MKIRINKVHAAKKLTVKRSKGVAVRTGVLAGLTIKQK